MADYNDEEVSVPMTDADPQNTTVLVPMDDRMEVDGGGGRHVAFAPLPVPPSPPVTSQPPTTAMDTGGTITQLADSLGISGMTAFLKNAEKTEQEAIQLGKTEQLIRRAQMNAKQVSTDLTTKEFMNDAKLKADKISKDLQESKRKTDSERIQMRGEDQASRAARAVTPADVIPLPTIRQSYGERARLKLNADYAVMNKNFKSYDKMPLRLTEKRTDVDWSQSAPQPPPAMPLRILPASSPPSPTLPAFPPPSAPPPALLPAPAPAPTPDGQRSTLRIGEKYAVRNKRFTPMSRMPLYTQVLTHQKERRADVDWSRSRMEKRAAATLALLEHTGPRKHGRVDMSTPSRDRPHARQSVQLASNRRALPTDMTLPSRDRGALQESRQLALNRRMAARYSTQPGVTVASPSATPAATPAAAPAAAPAAVPSQDIYNNTDLSPYNEDDL